MTTYIALLRAINLAGRARVGMADLRACLTDLGFAEVRTLLQSGNALLGCAERGAAELETLLEREVESRLRVRTVIIVRSAAQWAKMVAGNPFPEEAERDPSHLVAVVGKTTPTAASVAALQGAVKGRELIRMHGGQVYITYPDGIGRSKLTTALIERHLGVRVTGRNWNTVLKLAEMAGG